MTIKIIKIISLYLVIKIAGTLTALNIFHRYTPLIDSMNYISGYYFIDLNVRTLIIQHITSFLVSITNPLSTHLIFSIFSSIGILIYLTKNYHKKFILLLLLLPSSFVWTSIVGKEAIFFGFLSLFLINWVSLINKKLNYQYIWVIFAFIPCLILRPHYSIGIAWLMVAMFIINIKKQNHFWLLLILFTVFIATICFFYPDLINRGYGAIDPNARASRFYMLGIDPSVDSREAYRSYLFLGFIFGIVGPLPHELINRPEFIPFFIEGVMIILSPILIGLAIYKNSFYNKENLYLLNFIYGVIPALVLLMIIHAPFGILNPGSAIRWRINFEMVFYIAPLLIYFELKKDAIKHTLSSK